MGDAALLLAVALLSVSQVLQKVGAQRHLSDARDAKDWLLGLLSPLLLLAILSLAGGAGLWLFTLYRMDVSRAFPFLSLGTVLVVVISRWALKEHVSASRWLGVVLIAIGVGMVAST
jgi:drug/metabolite transporter (DMT)-like permease